jgi:hypothetical protein
MRRCLFNVLAGLSLLLCVATAAMWVRSYYWRADQFSFKANHVVGKQETMTGMSLWSTRAGLDVGFIKGVGQADPSAEISRFDHLLFPPFRMRMMDERSFLHRHGFHFSWGGSDNGYVNSVRATWSRGFSLSVPYWFLMIGLSVHPGWRIFRRKKRGRHDGKTCIVCGYDLRATPDRCPECGTIPKKLAQNST